MFGQQDNWNSYHQFVQQAIPQVLNQMLQAGQINQQVATHILNSQNQWLQDFMMKLNQQGQVPQHMLNQLLQQYISGLVQRLVQSQQPAYPQGGYQQGGGAWGRPGGFPPNPYGQPNNWGNQSGYSNSPSFGGTPGMIQRPPNPFAGVGSAHETKPPVDEEVDPITAMMENQAVIVEYNEPEALTEEVASGSEDTIQAAVLQLSSNVTDDEITRVSAITPKSFLNDSDMLDFVEQNLEIECPKYFMQIGYKKAFAEHVPRSMVVNGLIDIQNALRKLPQDKHTVKYLILTFDDVISEMPRKLSNIFEAIVIDRFNEFLSAKCIHSSETLGKRSLSVSSLQDIVDLSKYGSQPDFVKEQYANATDYDYYMNHYTAKAVFELFNLIEVTPSLDDEAVCRRTILTHIENAVGNKKLSNSSVTIRDQIRDTDDMVSLVNRIHNEYCIFTIPQAVFITNLSIKGSPFEIATRSGKTHITMTSCQTDVEFFARDFFIQTHPVNMFINDDDTYIEYTLSRTTDKNVIVRVS